MSPSDIPPFWLAGRPDGGTRRFRLPLALRLGLMQGTGEVRILRVDRAIGRLGLAVLDAGGQSLAQTEIIPGEDLAVFLPAGTAALALRSVMSPLDAARLGLYPTSKLGLKLHTFIAGRLGERSPQKRWQAAGIAARTLRGELRAMAEASPAKAAADAITYARYRARFVGDFAEVPRADAAPRLAFLSFAGEASLADIAGCAFALASQTDPAFDWVLVVPVARLAVERDDLREATRGRARLIPVAGDAAAGLSAALAVAEAGLVSPLDVRGRPTWDAVAMLRATFAAFPDCALAYSDEERLDPSGVPIGGTFKPAFNRHLLESSNYIGSLFALPLADALRLGLDAGAGPAALYDLLLRHTGSLDARRIRHIPRIAYGAPDRPPGFDAATIGPAADALARHRGVRVEVTGAGRHLRALFPVPVPRPLVSIVVPTRDRAGLLSVALLSLIARTAYRDFEIVIVDNGSVEPETFALFAEVKARWSATTVVRDDGDFNFPRICNAGVDAAQGDLILLLNNDVEVVEAGWLDEMVALASRPGMGVVGAKLLFADRTVQHAGVIVGLFRYADHWFLRSAADAPGYRDRLRVRQDLSAVTAACMLIRRDVWDEIGPLDDVRFAEDCNDIDLCLRARRAGYGVVWTPFATLIHYESASRGAGKKRTKAHRERLKAQRARMEEIWHTSSFVDPHYNPNLARKSLFADLAQSPEGPRDPRTNAVE